MPYLQINESRLFLTDDPGDRLPVLLVHGFTCDSSDWMFQIPALRAAGHRVVAIDLRGHGRSDVPQDGYSIAGLASDLREVCRVLQIERSVLIGHSMGGGVVLQAAATYGDWVAGACSIDFEFATTEDLAGAKRISEMPPGDEPLMELSAFFAATAYTAASPQWLREIHRRRVLGMDPATLRASFREQGGADRTVLEVDEGRRMLSEVTCPTLLLRRAGHGLADDLSALARSTCVRGIEFAGNGHWLHQERSSEINSILLEWIDEVVDAASARQGGGPQAAPRRTSAPG